MLGWRMEEEAKLEFTITVKLALRRRQYRDAAIGDSGPNGACRSADQISSNTIMSFIMLEKGIFLETQNLYKTKHF
jgi:hypothetical protein